MKTYFKNSLLFPAATLLAVIAGPATAVESTLQFSDPSQPGHLVVKLAFGDLEIVGEDTTEITVQSDVAVQGTEQPRADGLRRLDSDNGFSMREAENTITLSFGWFAMGGRQGPGNAASDVAIAVPRNTALTIERGGTGAIAIRNITGDLEIRGAVGDVELDNVAGGLLLESTNGDIDANFTELPESKPVSITVVNGDVDVSIPSDARANVRLRTLRGEMLTDFSEEEIESRFENSSSLNLRVQEGAYQQAMATMAAAQEAFAAAVATSNLSAEEVARRQEWAQEHEARLQRLQEERRAALERRATLDEAAKSEKKTTETKIVVPSPQPMPTTESFRFSMPQFPNLPPMAGGKLVVGTLNGGGTEVLITTLTGTITLRKQE